MKVLRIQPGKKAFINLEKNDSWMVTAFKCKIELRLVQHLHLTAFYFQCGIKLQISQSSTTWAIIRSKINMHKKNITNILFHPCSFYSWWWLIVLGLQFELILNIVRFFSIYIFAFSMHHCCCFEFFGRKSFYYRRQ